MKMKHLLFSMLAFVITVFSLPTQSGATTELQRYIALHDRVLQFDNEEVRLVNAQMVVPFEKIARYLYADIVKTPDQITMTKNGTSISYNFMTNETIVNQVIETVNPIQIIDNVLYVPVRFLGESTGFKVDYLSSIFTARLYTDLYPHLDNTEFIHNVMNERKLTSSPKPTPSDQSGKPIVYLTFDDGPNRYTSEHLRILKAYKVKGTFFFVGKQINYYQSLTRQAYAEGHYLGLHSMTHDRKQLYTSSKAFMGEMQKESDLIKKLTGHTSSLVRAPYGSSPYVTPAMRDSLKNGSYKLWDWDVDPTDWKITEANYQQIIANVTSGVEKARLAKDKHIVVLLHDRLQTTKALSGIITWLQKQGYSIQPYNPELHVSQNFWHDKAL
jgi:peptidoglycan/xylan/chitin deacetylase (PgdA/CDA1 family)